MSDQKAKFRDLLKSECEKEYKLDFGRLSDIQHTEGFLIVFIKEILSKKYPDVFPQEPTEIREFITDGSNDQNCDFIFSKDGHHYIIQSKYRKSNVIEDDKDVGDFMNVLERLHFEHGKDFKKNQKLIDAISNINFKEDTFELIFLSLGRSNDDIKNKQNMGISNVDKCKDLKDISERASFQFYSETELNMDYRDIINGVENITVKIEVSKGHNTNWYKVGDDNQYTSYITSISASQVHQIYTEHRTKLFNLNIRQHLGDNKTNKEIKNTVEEEPEHFFFYNNGLSAVASEIIEKEASLECKNFSIINGAQTFRSISKGYAKGISISKDVKNCSVMLRVTKIPNLFKKDGFLDNVTRFNNTQNVVKISDFRSNDKVQVSLNKLFSNIRDENGKEYFYKNKRGKLAKRNSISIILDDFCRRLFAFLNIPIDCVTGGQNHLYDTSKNGGYFFLFGDKDENSETYGEILESISDDFFKYLSSIFFITETVGKIFVDIKKSRVEREKKNVDNDESLSSDEKIGKPIISESAFKSKYHIYFIIGIFMKNYCNSKNIKLRDFLEAFKFHKPKVWRKEKMLNIFKEMVSVSCDVWYEVYSESYLKGGINHRNWLRKSENCELIKNKILNSRISDLDRINKSFDEI